MLELEAELSLVPTPHFLISLYLPPCSAVWREGAVVTHPTLVTPQGIPPEVSSSLAWGSASERETECGGQRAAGNTCSQTPL